MPLSFPFFFLSFSHPLTLSLIHVLSISGIPYVHNLNIFTHPSPPSFQIAGYRHRPSSWFMPNMTRRTVFSCYLISAFIAWTWRIHVEYSLYYYIHRNVNEEIHEERLIWGWGWGNWGHSLPGHNQLCHDRCDRGLYHFLPLILHTYTHRHTRRKLRNAISHTHRRICIEIGFPPYFQMLLYILLRAITLDISPAINVISCIAKRIVSRWDKVSS